VVAAISVGGPRVRLNPDVVAGIARRLPEAAAEISERLGWRGSAPVPAPAKETV
jgi:DNA-binding IclR family transcriptional regulator